MSLPAAPPPRSEATLPVRRGSGGWPVYALQCALVDAAGQVLVRDGAFGLATDLAVRAAQRYAGLDADGVAGPKTWVALTDRICRRVNRLVPDVSVTIVKGFARGEGGNHGAAVNWGVAGGVDCGLFQHRVLGPPFSLAKLRVAFSPVSEGLVSMIALRDRARDYSSPHSRCPFSPLQLAVLAHNFPWAAGQYHRYGRLPNPSKRCSIDDIIGYDEAVKPIYGWVPRSLPESAKTYEGWCFFYVRMITGTS